MPENKLFRAFFRGLTITIIVFIPWLLVAGLVNWAYILRGKAGMPLWLHVAVAAPFLYWGVKLFRKKSFRLGERYRTTEKEDNRK